MADQHSPVSWKQRPWGEALFWSVALSLLFVVVYGQCNAMAARRTDVGTLLAEWELLIPFVPILILPYMSIDLFFVGSFFTTLFRSRRRAARFGLAICGRNFNRGGLLLALSLAAGIPTAGGGRLA